MDLLLPYHNEILKCVIAEDALSVFCAGIGIEVVELHLIKILQNPKSTIFVLNFKEEDLNFFMNQDIKKVGLKVVDSKISVKNRSNCYTSPGVVFISPRIFIYDVLVRKISMDFITGLIIFHAHEIEDNMHLEFSIKIFRENNKNAFIKSMTDAASFFRKEFNLTSRVLKKLHVNNLLLWPRFHVKIAADLDKYDVDVVEINVTLTKNQTIMQTALVDLLSKCLQQLLKCSPELALYKSFLTIDHVISREFYKFINYVAKTIVGTASAQIYDDLKVIRLLLVELTNLNAFEFENKLQTIKKMYQFGMTSSEPKQLSGTWLFSDSAESLFIHSTQRLSFIASRYDHFKNAMNSHILDEICPKWRALSDIFNEISLSELNDGPKPDKWKVLVMCLPKTKISSFFAFKRQPEGFLERVLDRQDIKNEEISSEESSDEEHESEMQEHAENVEKPEIPVLKIESWSDSIDYKIIRTWDKYSVHQELYGFQPHVVILYDVTLAWIRQIEVLKALKRVFPIRVYMILHKDSMEEKIYLSSVDSERESFETLISEKAIISMPTEETHSTEEQLELDSRKIEERISGNVIVDIREFGSELPLMLHKAGFTIQPVTLEIGDYVLTPDIGIERKSIPDLISSLNSGRLYDQSMALARNYKHPFLLIEFNDRKLFHTGIFSKRSSGSLIRKSSFYVQSKLLLLTLHCPTLKILWSTSPSFTARLFFELKKGKPDPDIELISTITSYETNDIINISTNKSYDYLLRFPGITAKSAPLISQKAQNFHQLSKLSAEELEQILGDDGQKIYQIFNTEVDASAISNK